jgi:hypothetical protein
MFPKKFATSPYNHLFGKFDISNLKLYTTNVLHLLGAIMQGP